MVDGSLVQAKGWGGVLISLGTNTYMISPVFHCLKNPKNTFTPTTVLSFSKFSRAIVDTHHKVVLVDNNNTRHDIITTKDTDLDFVDLNIVMINPDASIQIGTNLHQHFDQYYKQLYPSINAISTMLTQENSEVQE